MRSLSMPRNAQIESLLMELGHEPAAILAVQPEMLVAAAPIKSHDTAEAEGESGSAGKQTQVNGPLAQRLNAGLFRLPKESAAHNSSRR